MAYLSSGKPSSLMHRPGGECFRSVLLSQRGYKMSSARPEREPEFADLQGAEYFEYDPFVPHRRLAERSMKVVMDRINLHPFGRTLVTDIRNRPHLAPHGPDDLGNITGTYPLRLLRMLLNFACLGVPYLALLMRESPVFNSRLIELWPNVAI